jgi:hypothetical protein
MRLATYNVEWFDHLFDDEGQLRNDAGWSGRQDVTRAEQTAALVQVFHALDADAVMVIEAPDQNGRRRTARALETFAARARLRARAALIGFPTDTQQEIAILYDPDRLTLRHDPRGAPAGRRGGKGVPRFDGTYRVDLDHDGHPEPVTWSKPPLELAAETPAGRRFRMIGVHAKSKAPHGARTPAEVTRLSIENRRKQLAQCLWLRARVDEHLAAGDDLIVLGDFNDGPGLDEYESLFGRSGVEVVMGDGTGPRLHDPHVPRALKRRLVAPPVTARFRMPDGDWLQALLDYIMVSPGLAALAPRWRIWHPFDNAACFADPALRDALLTASDHFPVTLDIDL